MRYGSIVNVTATVLTLLAACSNDDTAVVTTPAGTSFVVPVTDFDYYPDTALWDDGFYDPVLIAGVVGQVVYGGGSIDASVVSDAGVVLDAGAVIQSSGLVPRPLGSLLSLWRATITPACAPTVVSADNDQDGIPANYDATFNCTGITSGDLTSTVTGNVVIVDANDNLKAAGETITFTNFAVAVADKNGTSRSRTLNGTVALAPSGTGSFQATQSLTTNFVIIDSSSPNDQAQGTYVSNAVGTYTPDAGLTDPFASGTVNLSGGGTLTRNFNGANVTRAVTRTTNPVLHWNRACRTQDSKSTGYDSGKLTYADATGSSLTISFSGCGNPDVSTQ